MARLPEIVNWEDLIRKMTEHANQAAKKGVIIPLDAYFFLVSKKEPRTVDFILGDYDRIDVRNLPPSTDGPAQKMLVQTIADKNIEGVEIALGYFVIHNVAEPKRTEYIETLYSTKKLG